MLTKRHLYAILAFFFGFVLRPWVIRPDVDIRYKEVPVEVTRWRTREVIKYVTKASKEKPNHKERVEVYVPPEGHIEIRPKDKTKSLDDLIEVKRKWYGLTFKPGFQYDVIRTGVGLDVKLFFVSRVGFTVGGLIDKTTFGMSMSPTTSLSYRLDGISKGWLSNTESYIGYAPLFTVPVTIGFRINF